MVRGQSQTFENKDANRDEGDVMKRDKNVWKERENVNCEEEEEEEIMP